jgi:hypothetical protein
MSAMTVDEVFRQTLAKLDQAIHYLIAYMLNSGSELILLLYLRYLPSKWIILLKDPAINFTKRFTPH